MRSKSDGAMGHLLTVSIFLTEKERKDWREREGPELCLVKLKQKKTI